MPFWLPGTTAEEMNEVQGTLFLQNETNAKMFVISTRRRGEGGSGSAGIKRVIARVERAVAECGNGRARCAIVPGFSLPFIRATSRNQPHDFAKTNPPGEIVLETQTLNLDFCASLLAPNWSRP
jgi:hypothetical protein